jgi:predicted alpha/beta hydrolase
VLLVHGHLTGPEGFELGEEQALVRRLHRAGHDVFLMTHRGDRGSIAPTRAAAFDFDDIVSLDVPAALERVREATGARRVLWVGHSLGGQLLVAHLARGGAEDIAGGAALCAPVRFEVPRTHARLARLTANLLPASWRIPTRAVHQALAPFADRARPWQEATRETEGPVTRGMMVHGTEDISAGMARQVAAWLSSGSLCDRGDQVDYVAAMQGTRVPLWVLAADGDHLCSPRAAEPLVHAGTPGRVTWTVLGSRWGHLDPLVGRDAPGQVHAPLVRWLDAHRDGCWDDVGR